MKNFEEQLEELMEGLPQEVQDEIKKTMSDLKAQQSKRLNAAINELEDINNWFELANFINATLSSSLKAFDAAGLEMAHISTQMLVNIVLTQCLREYRNKDTTIEEFCTYFVSELIPVLRAEREGSLEELKFALHDTTADNPESRTTQ